ncbi:hypothetical protein D1094_07600 [Colwellia sp. RSH04]|nr:hypothetical protein D1094_07600 [Colwellia sp. RSH04]
MLPLYCGYLIFQLSLVFGLFYKVNISASAVFFSIIVFIVWTFIPTLGYTVAKWFLHKKPDYVAPSTKVLFFTGLIIGFIEQAWFYFNISIREQSNLSTFIVFILFFLAAFITLPKRNGAPKHSHSINS